MVIYLEMISLGEYAHKETMILALIFIRAFIAMSGTLMNKTSRSQVEIYEYIN